MSREYPGTRRQQHRAIHVMYEPAGVLTGCAEGSQAAGWQQDAPGRPVSTPSAKQPTACSTLAGWSSLQALCKE